MNGPTASQRLGQHGEQRAAEFLLGLGYRLLGSNLRLPVGEIDLLMEDGEVLVLVEVKTQRSGSLSAPIYKIDRAKQAKLRLLGQVLAAQYPDRLIRIDAISIYWQAGQEEPVLEHLQNILD